MISDLNLDHINLLKSSEFSREKLFNFQEGGKVECNFCNEAFYGAGSAHKHLTYDCAVAGLRKIGGSRLTYSNQTTMTFLEQSPLETLERKVFEITGVLCPPDSSRELMIALLREYAKYYKQNIRHHEIRLYLQNALRDITMRENELKYSNGVQINNYNIQIGDYDRKLKEYQSNYDFYTARQNQFQGQMRFNQAEQSVVHLEIQKLQREIIRLESQLSQCKSRTKLDEASLEQLEAQIIALGGQSPLGQQAVGIVQGVRGIQEQQQQVKSGQMVAKSKLDACEEELAKYRSRVSDTISDFSESSSQWASSNLTFNSDSESVRSSITDRIGELEQESNNLSKPTNDPVRDALNRSRESSINSELGSLRSALSQLSSDEERIKALEADRDDWEKKYNKLNKKWEKLHNDLNTKIAFCDDLIVQNGKKISESSKRNISQNYILKTKYEKEIERLKKEIASKDEELKNLKGLKSALQSIQLDLDGKNTKIEELLAESKKREKELTAFRKQIKEEKDKTEEKIKKQLVEILSKSKSVSSKLTDKQSGGVGEETIDSLLSKILQEAITNESNIDLFKKNQETKVKDISRDLETLKGEKQGLDGQLKEERDKVAKLNEEIQKIRTGSPDVKAIIEEYKKTFRQTIEEILGHFDTTKLEFKNIKTYSEDLIKKFNEQKKHLSSFKSKTNNLIQQLNNNKDKNEDELNNINDEFENIENVFDEIVKSVCDIIRKKDANKTKIAGKISELKGIKAENEELKKNYTLKEVNGILNIIVELFGKLNETYYDNDEDKDLTYLEGKMNTSDLQFLYKMEDKNEQFKQFNNEKKKLIIQTLNSILSKTIITNLFEFKKDNLQKIEDNLQTIRNNEAQIEKLEAKITAYEEFEKTVNKEIGNIKKYKEKLDEQFKNVVSREEYNKLNAELMALKSKQSSAITAAEKAAERARVSSPKSIKTAPPAILPSQSTNISQLKSEIISLTSKISDLELSLKNKNAMITSLSSQDNSIEKITQEFQDIIDEKDKEILSLNQKIESNETENKQKIIDLKIKIIQDILGERINIDEYDDTEFNNKIQEIKYGLNRYKYLDDTEIHSFNDISNDIYLSSELVELLSLLKRKDDKDDKKKLLSNLIKKIDSKIKKNIVSSTSLTKSKDDSETELSRLKNMEAVINGYINGNTNIINFLNKEQLSKSSLNEKITKLLGNWSSLFNQSEDIKSEKEKLVKKAKSLKENYDTANSTLTDLIQKFKELKSAYDETKKQVKEYESKVLEAEASVQSLKDQLQQCKESKTSLFTKQQLSDKIQKAEAAKETKHQKALAAKETEKQKALAEERKKAVEAAAAKEAEIKQKLAAKDTEHQEALAEKETEYKKALAEEKRKAEEAAAKQLAIKQCEDYKKKIIEKINHHNKGYRLLRQQEIFKSLSENELIKILESDEFNNISKYARKNNNLESVNRIECTPDGDITGLKQFQIYKYEILNDFEAQIRKAAEAADSNQLVAVLNCKEDLDTLNNIQENIKQWEIAYGSIYQLLSTFNKDKSKYKDKLEFINIFFRSNSKLLGYSSGEDKLKFLKKKYCENSTINSNKLEQEYNRLQKIINDINEKIKKNKGNSAIINKIKGENKDSIESTEKQIIEICRQVESIIKASRKNSDNKDLQFKLINLREDVGGVVRIYVRVNTFLLGNKKAETAVYIKPDPSNKINCSRNIEIEDKSYGQFYGVFSDATNEDIYNGFTGTKKDPKSKCTMTKNASDPINTTIKQVLSGYNINIFGYGYSGSGKTYTLFGKPDGKQNNYGIVQLVFSDSTFMDEVESVKISRIMEMYGLGSTVEAPQIYNNRNFQTTTGISNDNIPSYLKSECTDEINYFDSIERALKTNKKLKKLIKFKKNEIIFNNKKDIIDAFVLINDIIEVERKINGGIKETPNNPESSRGHLFITFEIKTSKGIKGNLTIGDFGGIESPIDILKDYFPTLQETFPKEKNIYKLLANFLGDKLKSANNPNSYIEKLDSAIKVFYNRSVKEESLKEAWEVIAKVKEDLFNKIENKQEAYKKLLINENLNDISKIKDAFIVGAKLVYNSFISDLKLVGFIPDNIIDEESLEEFCNYYGYDIKYVRLVLHSLYDYVMKISDKSEFKAMTYKKIIEKKSQDTLLENQIFEVLQIFREGFYINETLNNMKAFFLNNAGNYVFKDTSVPYKFGETKEINFVSPSNIRYPTNLDEFLYIYNGELFHFRNTELAVLYTYDKFRSFYLPIFKDKTIEKILSAKKDKSIEKSIDFKITSEINKERNKTGLKTIYSNLKEKDYNNYIAEKDFTYMKFNNYTYTNKNDSNDNTGMFSILTELDKNRNKDKPSKFVMFALVRPESDDKFVEGAIATLQYAQMISSTSKATFSEDLPDCGSSITEIGSSSITEIDSSSKPRPALPPPPTDAKNTAVVKYKPGTEVVQSDNNPQSEENDDEQAVGFFSGLFGTKK